MRKLLISSLLFFGCVLSVSAYADFIRVDCKDGIVPWEGRNFTVNVTTIPQFQITNDTNVTQTIHVVAKTIDPSNGKTGAFYVKDKTLAAHEQWGASPLVNMLLSIMSHGEHPFKGVVDITGFKPMHAEGQCHILAKKYIVGDYANGIVEHSFPGN